MMRIAHVVDYFQPELGYQETHLALAHVRAGHEVLVITSVRTFPFRDRGMAERLGGPRERRPGNSVEGGVRVLRLPIGLELRTRVWMKGLRGAIRNFDPDTVVAHGLGNFTSVRAALALDQHHARLVVDDHMLAHQVQRGLAPAAWRLGQRVARRLVLDRRVDLFAPITTETLDVDAGMYGVDPSRCVVLPLGTWVEDAPHGPEARRAARHGLGVPQDAFTVGHVGRFSREKKIELLVDATRALRDASCQAVCVIVGAGDEQYVEEVRKRAASKGVQDYVRFHGPVRASGVPSVLPAFDVAVWPANQSATMLDALAAGCALVIPNHPGLQTYLEGQTGLALAHPGEVTRVLMRLASDPVGLKAMQHQARERAWAFDWNRIAARFLSEVPPNSRRAARPAERADHCRERM